MHDIKWIRDNAAAFDRGLERRGLPPEASRLIAIDERRRTGIAKLEQAQARRNAASKEIAEAKRAKNDAGARALMAEVAELKNPIPAPARALARVKPPVADGRWPRGTARGPLPQWMWSLC